MCGLGDFTFEALVSEGILAGTLNNSTIFLKIWCFQNPGIPAFEPFFRAHLFSTAFVGPNLSVTWTLPASPCAPLGIWDFEQLPDDDMTLIAQEFILS